MYIALLQLVKQTQQILQLSFTKVRSEILVCKRPVADSAPFRLQSTCPYIRRVLFGLLILSLLFTHHPFCAVLLFLNLLLIEMPRKAAAATEGSADAPRRSSRIKELPKATPAPPVKKAPAKPRVKKADKEADDKPKSARKRKASEDDAEDEAEDDEKPAKKVRH